MIEVCIFEEYLSDISLLGNRLINIKRIRSQCNGRSCQIDFSYSFVRSFLCVDIEFDANFTIFRRARGRISRAPRHRDLDVEGSNNFNERKEVEKICVDPDSKQYTSGYYKYTKRLGENSRIETDFWDNESDQNSNYKTYNNSETDDAQKSNDDQMKDDGSFEFEFDYQLMKFEEQHIASDGLPKVQFNELFQINTKFEVYIAQVHSPYKFWFQLKEDSEKLFTLMSAME